MSRKQIAVLALGLVTIFIGQSSVAWSQAGNVTMLAKGSNNHCAVDVSAFSIDCNGNYDPDSDQDSGDNSAGTIAVANGSAAWGTGAAHGSAVQFGETESRVRAKGSFTADAFGTDDFCLSADGRVETAYGSSHHWARFRVNGNSTFENQWGLPHGWLYKIEGTFTLELNGDRVQWAGVKGPGIDLRIENRSGAPILHGSVTQVEQNDGKTTVTTTNYDRQPGQNAPSTFSAIVTPDSVFELWAGGSAGIYSADWTSHNGVDFSYAGSGEGVIEITRIIGVPPLQQGGGEVNGGGVNEGGVSGGGYDEYYVDEYYDDEYYDDEYYVDEYYDDEYYVDEYYDDEYYVDEYYVDEYYVDEYYDDEYYDDEYYEDEYYEDEYYDDE